MVMFVRSGGRQVPLKPTSFSASESGTVVAMTCAATHRATRYNWYLNGVQIGTSANPAFNAPLESGDYTVKAANSAGEGPVSNTQSVTIATATDTLAPTIPLGLIESSYTDTSVLGLTCDPFTDHLQAGYSLGRQDAQLLQNGSVIQTVTVTPGTSPILSRKQIGSYTPVPSSSGTIPAQSLVSAGTGIASTSDQYCEYSSECTDDFWATVKLNSFTNYGSGSRGGVVARVGTSASAPVVAGLISQAGAITVYYRETAGATLTTGSALTGYTFPCWLRLRRSGDKFTVSISQDSNVWTRVQQVTVAVGSTTMNVGVAAYGNNSTTEVTVAYDQLNISDYTPISFADITGLSPSTAYTYTVRSRDLKDTPNVSSSGAGRVITTLASATDTAPPTVPGTPTPTAISSSTVRYTWTASTDVSGIRGYIPMTAATSGGTYTDQPEQTGLTYDITGLSSGTTRYFKVRAIDNAGNESSATSEVSGTSSTSGVAITRLLTDNCDGASPSTIWQISSNLGTSDVSGGEYVVRNGSPAHRIDLTYTAMGVSFRNEVAVKPQTSTGWNGRTTFADEYWFAFSIILPAASDPLGATEWVTSTPDNYYEYLAQLHDSLPRTTGYPVNPPVSLNVSNPGGASARWTFSATGRTGGAGGPTGSGGTGQIDCGAWASDLGTEVRWVMRIAFRTDTTGYVEVWKNGVKVVSTFNIPIGWYQESGYAPYFKAGLYCGWANSSPSAPTPLGPTVRDHYKLRYRISKVVGNTATAVDTSNPGYVDVA